MGGNQYSNTARRMKEQDHFYGTTKHQRLLDHFRQQFSEQLKKTRAKYKLYEKLDSIVEQCTKDYRVHDFYSMDQYSSFLAGYRKKINNPNLPSKITVTCRNNLKKIEKLRSKLGKRLKAKDRSSSASSPVKICRCLFEPGRSRWMRANKVACNREISRRLGVRNWKSINLSRNRKVSLKFNILQKNCNRR